MTSPSWSPPRFGHLHLPDFKQGTVLIFVFLLTPSPHFIFFLVLFGRSSVGVLGHIQPHLCDWLGAGAACVLANVSGPLRRHRGPRAASCAFRWRDALQGPTPSAIRKRSSPYFATARLFATASRPAQTARRSRTSPFPLLSTPPSPNLVPPLSGVFRIEGDAVP